MSYWDKNSTARQGTCLDHGRDGLVIFARLDNVPRSAGFSDIQIDFEA